jgi:hypothetical protein
MSILEVGGSMARNMSQAVLEAEVSQGPQS